MAAAPGPGSAPWTRRRPWNRPRPTAERAGSGRSSDSVGSHEAFAGRHRLPFLLLSDDSGAVRKRYGVHRSLGVVPGRVTYVIDRQGTVRHVFSSMTRIDQHVNHALRVVQQLHAEPSTP